MLRWVAPLLFLSLLAGCVEPAPGADDSVVTDAASDAERDPGPRVASDVEVPDESPTDVLVYHANGTLKGAVTYLAFVEQTGDGPLGFQVPKNATRIVATLHWNGTGDVDPVLLSPHYCGVDLTPEDLVCMMTTKAVDLGADDDGWHRAEGGSPSAPDSPAVLVLEGDVLRTENDCQEDACRWGALVYANPVADVTYHMQAEVHFA